MVEEFRLVSATFNNSRTIRVLLPPCYSDSRLSYPVLYLNDGVMVFKPSAINIAGVMHTLYSERRVAPLIVVGMDNGASTDGSANAVGREDEYLPYPDSGFPGHTYPPDPPHPRGTQYPAFLHEVMREVVHRYRVSTRRADTAIGGFSYGGDAALYAALQRPMTFGKLLIESTPPWIGEKRLIDDARRATKLPERVVMEVGGKETNDPGINQEGLTEFEELRAALAHPGVEVLASVDPEGTHTPASWRRRLPKAIEMLFRAKRKDPGSGVLR